DPLGCSRTRFERNPPTNFSYIGLLLAPTSTPFPYTTPFRSYLGFKDRAANNATKANLRAALPSAEAYYGDNGTYVGMTPVTLKGTEEHTSALQTRYQAVCTPYLLTDTVNGKPWSVKGPGPSS